MSTVTKSNEPWKRAWELASRHGAFLRVLANRYRKMVADDGAEEADDLLQTFVLHRLPGLVDRLERLDDDAARERYLVVAFRNFVRDHRRAAVRYRSALAALSADPSLRADAPDVSSVRRLAEDEVPPALRAYFESGGRTESIRQIAAREGISRHAARKAVVDSVLRLTLKLGGGMLEPGVAAISELVLLHGLSIEETAQQLGLTEHQVRSGLAAARGAVEGVLQTQRRGT